MLKEWEGRFQNTSIDSDILLLVGSDFGKCVGNVDCLVVKQSVTSTVPVSVHNFLLVYSSIHKCHAQLFSGNSLCTKHFARFWEWSSRQPRSCALPSWSLEATTLRKFQMRISQLRSQLVWFLSQSSSLVEGQWGDEEEGTTGSKTESPSKKEATWTLGCGSRV